MTLQPDDFVYKVVINHDNNSWRLACTQVASATDVQIVLQKPFPDQSRKRWAASELGWSFFDNRIDALNSFLMRQEDALKSAEQRLIEIYIAQTWAEDEIESIRNLDARNEQVLNE